MLRFSESIAKHAASSPFADAGLNTTPRTRLPHQFYAFIGTRNIRTRREFPYVLDTLGLTDEGVEVGVSRGNSGDFTLRTWYGRGLYSIDPVRRYPDSCYIEIDHFGVPAQEEMFLATSKRLSEYRERCEVVRQASPVAANHFADGKLDCAYIDA